MLEGLDEIDWSKLSHAYGEATDVPGQLRGLVSEDKEERSQAFGELCGGILHQGTIYEATAFVVPFLIELLKSTDLLDKNEILILLAQIACGTSYHDVHQHARIFREKAKTEEWQGKIREELVWVENAKAAVQAEEPLYLELLSEPDSSIREASAYVLARLPQRSALVAEAIWKRFLMESAMPVKVSLVLSLGIRAPSNEMGRLMELFAAASDKSIVLAAAISVVNLAPAEAPQNVIEFLVKALGQQDKFPAFSKTIRVTMEDFDWCTMEILGKLTGDAAAIAEKEIGMGLRGTDPKHSLACVETLLRLAFGTGVPRGTAFKSLTDKQRRTVRILAKNPGIWDQSIGGMRLPNVQTALLLRSCGLPDKLGEFTEFAADTGKKSL